MLLGRLTGRTDVVFGTTVSGRPADVPGIESMIGLFVNTVPVRVRAEPALPVGVLLDRVQAEQAALLDHQHLGLAEVQRQVGLGELFDTLTVIENYPDEDDEPAAGLRLVEVEDDDATHYPLTLVAHPGRGRSWSCGTGPTWSTRPRRGCCWTGWPRC